MPKTANLQTYTEQQKKRKFFVAVSGKAGPFPGVVI